MDKRAFELSRREILKCGAMAGVTLIGSSALSSAFAQQSCLEDLLLGPTACGINEIWATSPFIKDPFIDPLPVPPGNGPVGANAPLTALRPGYRDPDGVLLGPNAAWEVRKSQPGCVGGVVGPALMDDEKQDSYGGTHQCKPNYNNSVIGFPGNFPLAANPICYHIRVQVAAKRFTTSRVIPINRRGLPVLPPPAAGITLVNGTAVLPASTIYGFNGTFPGPMINVDYGRPVVVRFENDLDQNPLGLNRGDFGVDQFLTHLHNGHTAPESDGQPHYMQHNEGGYNPGDFVDNLYLNWPAGGDPREIQSFLWFHDHRMHHTGANVYKGMVGLYPMYDAGAPNPLDTGDERTGLRLPGVRTPNLGADGQPDGSFNVKYDIPMALYDTRLDDGVTPHADFRVDPNVCGTAHPEQWGKTFFRYHPNHGYVGDIFTVNGTAYPVLHVFRRKYRLRFLGASISRIYELALMTSTRGHQARPGTQGQWQIPDGQQCMKLTQIASMGGLLPKPIIRDSFQIWPATRREVIVDFTKFMDGSPTKEGSVIYLTNVIDMPDGRIPKFIKPGTTEINKSKFKVPLVKIVVHNLPAGEVDNSVMPSVNTTLRPMPVLPSQSVLNSLPRREFTLERSGQFGDAAQWVINGLPFDPAQSLTELPNNPGNPGNIGNPKRGRPEIWTLKNGGGGWVHPMHMHQEEHTILSRVGSLNPHPDDTGKEDVVNLDPSESVTFYRNFRTFVGPYVAHCHNLAHEDHNMMFGWTIDP
jgi:FtsP/CotA-like multicopper oxidase with cupredoxin domain